MDAVQQGQQGAPAELSPEMEVGQGTPSRRSSSSESEIESAERVSRSLELLSHYSTENHPGHQPGRFLGPGAEYDGMTFDGLRWHMKKSAEGDGGSSTALAKLSEADRVLVTKFESEGGLALCLANAFKGPERMRKQAKQILQVIDGDVSVGEDGGPIDLASLGEIDTDTRKQLEAAGLGPALELMKETSPVEKALLLLQAADMVEEREAVMRNVWSDVEFHGGEASNAELVSQLERQFATQLVRSTEVRLEARDEAKRRKQNRGLAEEAGSADNEKRGDHSAQLAKEPPRKEKEDGIFEIALRGCSEANALAKKLPEQELNATLLEPRNLGVALDLVGVYLKNYEIDKADLVITRIVPLRRKKAGSSTTFSIGIWPGAIPRWTSQRGALSTLGRAWR